MGMTLEGVSEVSGEVGVSVEGEGKEGVTEQVLKSINDVLEARELIKIRLLNNCSLTTREVSAKVCEALDAEGVQCIGSIVVVYKRSSKKDVVHIEI